MKQISFTGSVEVEKGIWYGKTYIHLFVAPIYKEIRMVTQK